MVQYKSKIANLNKKTIAKKISILRIFFKYLEEKGYNFRIIGDEVIKIPKTPPKLIPITDIKKALNNASIIEYTAIITIFGLGVTLSEARNIILDNIKNESIEIINKKNEIRNIPLDIHLKENLTKYINLYTPKKYLFEKNNIQLSDMQLRYIIQKPFKKIGLKITPNQLRYSFAAIMVNNGITLNNISKLLGYKSIPSTQFYTKIDNSTKLQNYIKAHPLCSNN